jgi:branched-chain amino acid transport system permease protein
MLEGILINGLVRSGIYALLAIGFSLIFGVARMINLSFTSFYMLGAYGLYFFATRMGLNPVLAALISLILTAII